MHGLTFKGICTALCRLSDSNWVRAVVVRRSMSARLYGISPPWETLFSPLPEQVVSLHLSNKIYMNKHLYLQGYMPTVFGIMKTDFHFTEKLCALLHK